MTDIKYNIHVLRNVAKDLVKLRQEGTISDDAPQAHDRVENAHQLICEVANFFDGLYVGLVAGGVIEDKDE